MSAAVSVVIAAYNAETTLDEQLDALTAQAWPDGGEIIVADNGSTDRTAALVEQRRDAPVPIHLVDASEKSGAGHARNVGVAHARHDTIAFCDADDVVHERWVGAIAAAVDKTPAVGGGLEFDRLNPPWVVGSRGQLVAGTRLPLFDGVFPVLSSCNLGIRRELFEELGGFDTSYVRGQDAELSLRLHQHGVATGFAEDALVHYRMRGSIREIFHQARGWGDAQVALREALSADDPRHPSTWRSWLWLASRVPTLVKSTGRARWAYVAGIRLGTAQGRRRHTAAGARLSTRTEAR